MPPFRVAWFRVTVGLTPTLLRRCAMQGCAKMCAAADHFHQGEHDCGGAFHACPNQCGAPGCKRPCAQNQRQQHVCVCDDAALPVAAGTCIPAEEGSIGRTVTHEIYVMSKERRGGEGLRQGCMARCGVPRCPHSCADTDHHFGTHADMHERLPHHCRRAHPYMRHL